MYDIDRLYSAALKIVGLYSQFVTTPAFELGA
jgi:hypothetical protein